MNRVIQVYPDKSTPPEWRWRRRSGNNKTTATSGEAFDNRGNAIRAAREERGDRVLDLVDDGKVVGQHWERGGPEAIVLLRADGSVHGELSPPQGSAGEPQRVSIQPAGTSDGAEEVG